MNIQFHEKNLLADVVGKEHGLTRPEIKRTESKASRALKSFRRRSQQNVVGFPQKPEAREIDSWTI